jgi:DNA repair and recombination RAD54-like protein
MGSPPPPSPAPAQTIQIVCCPLSPLQTACYEGVLSSKTTKKVINGGKDLRVLNTIMGASPTCIPNRPFSALIHTSLPSLRADLKKLCNHPKLIYDSCISKKATDAFQDCMGFFEPVRFCLCTSPPARLPDSLPSPTRRACSMMVAPDEASRARDGRSWGALPVGVPRLRSLGSNRPLFLRNSGKFVVLCRLLQWLRQNTDDRIVIVSNYTQTLDLFQQLCREKCVGLVWCCVVWLARMPGHLIPSPSVEGGTRRCVWTGASP